jgi:hypothetical protein
VDSAQDSGQQRDAVADGEAGDVDRDVAHAIEEEDHTEEEQQVVVSGDHVFRPEVEERARVRTGDGFQEVGVAALDCVGEHGVGGEQKREDQAHRLPSLAHVHAGSAGDHAVGFDPAEWLVAWAQTGGYFCVDLIDTGEAGDESGEGDLGVAASDL